MTANSPPSGIEVSNGRWQDVYVGLPGQWELVGRGSFGKVYKARKMATGEPEAVKVIPTNENEALDGVRREVAILRDCDSPYIVAYRGCYFTGSELWIGMEFCGGGSVEQITSTTEEPLTEQQIAIVCCESLKGLAYLHKHSKIHRDVKGGNILLTDKGQVKLADFGVSAQLATTMSQRNTFVGTTYWMAPEVILERRYDGRADVWSVGITAIEMAELVPPHHNLHPMRALFQIPRGPPPTLSRRKDWSPAFDSFVKACLVKDSTNRPHAYQLLQHPFVKDINEDGPDTQCLLEAIAKWRAALAVKESMEAESKRDPRSKRPTQQPLVPELIGDAGDDCLHTVQHSSRSSGGSSATFVERASDNDSNTFVDHDNTSVGGDPDHDTASLVDGIALAAADAAAHNRQRFANDSIDSRSHTLSFAQRNHLERGVILDVPYVRLNQFTPSRILNPMPAPLASPLGGVEPRELYRLVADEEGLDTVTATGPINLTPTMGSLIRQYMYQVRAEPSPFTDDLANILKTICA